MLVGVKRVGSFERPIYQKLNLTKYEVLTVQWCDFMLLSSIYLPV